MSVFTKPGRPTQKEISDIVRNDRTIDQVFAESLFTLWMGGKTFNEIVELYKGTEQEFTLSMLTTACKDGNWKRRRLKILGHLRDDTDDHIVIEKRKQMAAFSMAMDQNLYRITKSYKDFIKDPDAFFDNPDRYKDKFWICNDLFTFKEFLGIFKDMTAPQEGAEPLPLAPQQGDTTYIANVNVMPKVLDDQEVRSRMSLLLKTAADSRHESLQPGYKEIEPAARTTEVINEPTKKEGSGTDQSE